MDAVFVPAKVPLPSKQYVRDLNWLTSRIGRLAVTYPNQWVAVRKAKVVASGEDLGKIKATLRKRFGGEEILAYFVDDGTIILCS